MVATAEINARETSARNMSERDDFRHAMRELAGGVSVVTTGTGLDRTGCTVTSFSSLSMDPPSVIVCINRGSSTLKAIRENGAFGVSQLSAGQQSVARAFADNKLYGAERFSFGDWKSLVTGSPLLCDALAFTDCELEDVIDKHTHSIVIGRVVAARSHELGAALVHWRGKFETLGVAQGI
jgi:flavin reductase (DIM6/NTAB) family NADH-FMN oxidoreductase RutF